MRIGIVLHPYGETAPAGLARTIFEFTRAMIEIDRENTYIIYLKKTPKIFPTFLGVNWRIEVLPGTGFFWLDSLRHATPADVYFFNTPVLPCFFRPKRSVALALDFAYLSLGWKTPSDSLRSIGTYLYQCYSLIRADRVVAISEATKRDLLAWFPVSSRKITIVLCGFTKICDVPPRTLPLPEPYLFFAGILKPRKNVRRIIEAFIQVAPEFPRLSLVVAGNPSGRYFEALNARAHDAGLSSRVIFAGHLTDAELSYAYRHARALVFPTLIEGFGYPILEAMHCGTPVLTSNRSSLEEIAGGAALMVNPYSVDSIAFGMRQLAADDAVCSSLIKKGSKRATEFSWQKSARELLALLT